MPANRRIPENEEIARRFRGAARILEHRGANPFRIRAYHRAADTVERVAVPLRQLLASEGVGGLERLPAVGRGLARAIQEYLNTGHMFVQERMAAGQQPSPFLTLPGIGAELAGRLEEELGLETLEGLEVAAWDGRLERVRGIGPKKLATIRQALAARLGRQRHDATHSRHGAEPPVAELLDVDRQYRRLAEAGRLPKIAPRRMNPEHARWLPLLHTARGDRHYTALFSNTPRAHQLRKTHDWVVIYHGDGNGGQHTVVTERAGPLKGQRVVRGRELECVGAVPR